MMLFGAIFRCLEPTLVIAASLAFRSPFFSPFDKRDEADAVKKSFEPLSDHLTLLKAYTGWEKARRTSKQEEREYLHVNFLSGQTLRMIEKMKTQFKQLLQEIRFYDRRQEAEQNANSGNIGLVRAILVAGLYPNVIKLDAGGGGGKKGGKGGKGGPKLKTRSIEQGGREEMVEMHPSSVLYGCTAFPTNFLIYHEKVKTSKVFVRDASVVSPLALLLFGGRVEVDHMAGVASVDKWLRLDVAAQHAVLVVALRNKLQEIMRAKIEDSTLNLFRDERATKVISAVNTLIEGFEAEQSKFVVVAAPSAFNQSRPGDWTCPGCKSNVFASKSQCFRCGAPKP
jgi:HrpA-like RNA helicase